MPSSPSNSVSPKKRNGPGSSNGSAKKKGRENVSSDPLRPAEGKLARAKDALEDEDFETAKALCSQVSKYGCLGLPI